MGHHFEGFDVEHNTSSNQFKYQRFVAKKFSAILAVAMKWVQNHVQQLQLGYCFLMGNALYNHQSPRGQLCFSVSVTSSERLSKTEN